MAEKNPEKVRISIVEVEFPWEIGDYMLIRQTPAQNDEEFERLAGSLAGAIGGRASVTSGDGNATKARIYPRDYGER